MARKVRGFERVLDAPALFAVAYDEIGSSIYFALGIVAAQALGLTPVVLLATGLLFLVVSLSYAEGTAAIPGERRRGDVHPPRLQRPRRLRDGLGALPRLPDRDRPLDALPPALPRGIALGPFADREPVGRADRDRRHRPHRRRPDHPPDADPLDRARPRSSSTSPCSCSWSSPGLACVFSPGGARRTGSISRPARAGTTSSSPCRSRCSPTPASRPSPTSPRRRASPAACCRARSSPRSASS